MGSEVKITVYHEARTTGGVSKVIDTLLNGKMPFNEYQVICPRSTGLSEWFRMYRKRGIPIYDVALRNEFDILGWFDWLGWVLLIRYIRKTQLIHFHLHTPFSCLPAIFLARLMSNNAIILTEHYISQLRYQRRRSLPFVLRALREIKIRTLTFLKSLSLQSVNAIVTVSESNAEYIRSVFGNVVADKLRVIPNGIDVSAFHAAKKGKREILTSLGITDYDDLIVTVVAGLNNQKGHEFLIRAIHSILQRIPNTYFLFVGEGHLRQHLEKMARTVSPRIVFTGFRNDIADILSVSDLFVLPSLFEGMPLSVLEAMAAGKAVVATAVDGTKEIVVHGETGLLVPPKDPVSLGNAICTLLSDRPLRERFGLKGRARVREFFSADVMTEAYKALYKEFLQ